MLYAKTMYRIILPLGLILSACAPGPQPETSTRTATPDQSVIPVINAFPSSAAPSPSRSNRDIARDFLDLSFQLESGEKIPTLARFEGPITLRVIGKPSPTLVPELNRLLYRLRNEAGIAINPVQNESASITVESVPLSTIQKYQPKAACFVAPNISKLSEYRGLRRSPSASWEFSEQRKKFTIVIPNDSTPQEIRDCLHEELAQALGPLNDLYRLPDSIFNDDNQHSILTGFDMLILRIYYASNLRSGMTREDVAARLPALLSRLNPAGDRITPQFLSATPRVWSDAIVTALGRGTAPRNRLPAAQKALRIAIDEGWTDNRRAFTHLSLGRLNQAHDAPTAVRHFQLAKHFYAATPGTEPNRAYTASQLAAYAISQGDNEEALRLISPHLRIAKRYENAALLASLLLLRAEALEQSGRKEEAHQVRLDSLGWARYGFGADWAIEAKLREIAALKPVKGPNG